MDTDTYEAIKQVVKELVLPELAGIRASIQCMEKKLSVPQRQKNTTSSHSPIRPLSPKGEAYIDAMVAEIDAKTERQAATWARQKAKDPQAKILTKRASLRKRRSS
jgi:hypothetical protein